MAKLSDIQTILLSTASRRLDGNLLPPPDSVGGAGKRIHTSLSALQKRGFAAEVEVNVPDRTWREDGDRRIGLVITSAGREAIGGSDEPGDGEGQAGRPETPQQSSSPAAASETPPARDALTGVGAAVARAGSKQALVVELLRRDGGATLAELVEATGWLPHTTRAALTGLRKKGHSLKKSKRGEVTCYSITEAR